jgi:hypothetical protein
MAVGVSIMATAGSLVQRQQKGKKKKEVIKKNTQSRQ